MKTLASGGLVVLDPARLVMLWAGRRRPSRDLLDRFALPVTAVDVERSLTNPSAILGGFAAVTAALGGNTIADYSTVLVYGDPQLHDLFAAADHEQPGFEPTEVWVLEPDPRLHRYGRTTPLVQAWVDLFNLAGKLLGSFITSCQR